MKRIIKNLKRKNHSIEFFHCASDPDSLDAFIDYDANIAMTDGTAPHTMDPDYPGAYDSIINLADCWDKNKLYANKSKIINLSNTISSCHRMATSCIMAATALLDSNMQTAKAYINHNTANEFIAEFAKKLEGCKTGREKKRLLSAVSVGRTVFFKDTIKQLASEIYVLPDEWGAASDLILSKINQAAAFLGLERIVCYCSIRIPDKIDHIIFPSKGIAITTSNEFHPSEDGHQLINNLLLDIPNPLREQMTLHLKKAEELIGIACEHIKQAKLLHDELEKYYIEAMNFSQVDSIFKKIANEID